MSLYPTFEGLTIGKEIEAQNNLAQTLTTNAACSNVGGVNYAALASEFLGLDLSLVRYDDYGNACYGGETAAGAVVSHAGTAISIPASGTIERRDPIEVSQGVREMTLCKNAKGLVGMQLRNQDCGVFVTYVERDSPAAMAGLRFGDQVLQINGQFTAGMCGRKAMNLIKNGPANNISVVIRDRPLERCVTLSKNSLGSVGMLIKDGKVDSIVEGSSAARNGVLVNHQLVEVNGVNVLGLSDKKIRDLLKTTGQTVKITLMPSFFFEHLSKKLGRSFLRNMDRSEPMA
ncbi:unnamed protein product [Mesocestoides corti]|uniref:Syntenin-1 n=1 Tax=Mesocestoides corti TaxID=53468 RepID=A0A0R3UL80_MESCO|nr:unnamed protein product [Mesocestoides corti]